MASDVTSDLHTYTLTHRSTPIRRVKTRRRRRRRGRRRGGVRERQRRMRRKGGGGESGEGGGKRSYPDIEFPHGFRELNYL